MRSSWRFSLNHCEQFGWFQIEEAWEVQWRRDAKEEQRVWKRDNGAYQLACALQSIEVLRYWSYLKLWFYSFVYKIISIQLIILPSLLHSQFCSTVLVLLWSFRFFSFLIYFIPHHSSSLHPQQLLFLIPRSWEMTTLSLIYTPWHTRLESTNSSKRPHFHTSSPRRAHGSPHT